MPLVRRVQTFMQAQEQAQIAKSSTVGRAARADPKQPVDAETLFSHGPQFGGKYQASTYALHYSDPARRAYGSDSADRVHKSFFWGNKHIDLHHAPKVEPYPRTQLLAAKMPMWEESKASAKPIMGNMYASVAATSWSKIQAAPAPAAGFTDGAR